MKYVSQPRVIPDIIRCKDCIHRGLAECPMLHSELVYDDDDGFDEIISDRTIDMGFCHEGEMEI